MLNKQKGNMYPFVSHTWNAVKGECPHRCSYCYCKRWGKQSPLHFDEKEMKVSLGDGNFIFVGSSTDMWAEEVLNHWIERTLEHCHRYSNRYLFQSKNPARFNAFLFPENTTLGTTIETNRHFPLVSKAPYPFERMKAMVKITLPRMISIEPIMDFDFDVFVEWMHAIKPEFVSIGADSKGHKLPEPEPSKILDLIAELQGFTAVKIKDNLKRLVPALTTREKE